MTNNEMLLAAMEFEEVEFAYDLYFLIQEGIVSPNAEYIELGSIWNKVDRKITNEWRENNLLGFDLVYLYCMRLNVDDWELFMAKSDEEARGYALNKFGFLPKIIKMPSEKWLQTFWIPSTKEYKSLLEIRKEAVSFPCTALII